MILRGRTTAKRSLTLTAATALLAAAPLVVPVAAHAADRTPVIIVGTSDVSDSNLVAGVLEPGFEKAYPQYDLQYVPKGTGAAITYAEQGSADGLIVHAASLENQFVDQGYSNEQYGRAVFWGDYVLLGPQDDPAGVLTSAPDDAATAFEKIAALGAQGKANFVSRSNAPGTTVQEHAIWSLTNTTSLCTVSAANGGGSSPSNTTGDCPTQPDYPDWYHSGDRQQAANIINANSCPYEGGNCYVLTDRGTYQYQNSLGTVPNLKIVTRNNASAARGGSTLLVNSFHAYAINPAKFQDSSRTINSAGATAFLNWTTSTAGQQAVGDFEADDDEGAPFIPSAMPTITPATLPAQVKGGAAQTLTGSLKNVVPGTPALANQTVNLNSTLDTSPTGAYTKLQSTTTNADGNFKFVYTPARNAKYTVTTAAISQIENAQLNPKFGDLLAPSTSAPFTQHVLGQFSSIKASSPSKGALSVTAGLAPPTNSANARIYLYYRKPGTVPFLLNRVAVKPPVGAKAFGGSWAVPSGKLEFTLYYVDSPFIDPYATPTLYGTIR